MIKLFTKLFADTFIKCFLQKDLIFRILIVVTSYLQGGNISFSHRILIVGIIKNGVRAPISSARGNTASETLRGTNYDREPARSGGLSTHTHTYSHSM